MQQVTEQQIVESGQLPTVLVALGANLPVGHAHPEENIRAAMRRLEAVFGGVTGKSRLFKTPAFPPGSGPDYVNAALALRSALMPGEILKILHKIENEFDRERAGRWGARTLDLDLLAVGSAVFPDAPTQTTWRQLGPQAQQTETPVGLILPHPRLQDRAFVLVPLLDVAADWRHPLTGESVRQMCAGLPADALADIVPIEACGHGD